MLLRNIRGRLLLVGVLGVFVSLSYGVKAQTGADAHFDPVPGLTSRYSAIRQLTAERVARAALPEHLKLVEGFHLQEKDAKAKLALDWALYRLGKSERIFPLVKALDSSRHAQAHGYLIQLDDPEPLYTFLGQGKSRAQVRLLNVLSRIGRPESEPRIQPYVFSSDRRVASAARNTLEQIRLRTAQLPEAERSRPRKVGEVEDESP